MDSENSTSGKISANRKIRRVNTSKGVKGNTRSENQSICSTVFESS